MSSESPEMLGKQMLLLGVDDLNNLCETNPEANEICSSYWFWIEKIKRDLPETPDVFGDIPPRTLYEILIRDNLLETIKLDLPKLYTYISNNSTLSHKLFNTLLNKRYILEAAKFSSHKVLRLLLKDGSNFTEAYEWTISDGTPETLQVFIDAMDIKASHADLARAAIAGRIDNLGVLLSGVAAWPIDLFGQFGLGILTMTPEQREALAHSVGWLNEKRGLLSDEDDVNVAIATNDFQAIKRSKVEPTRLMASYGRKFGSMGVKSWLDGLMTWMPIREIEEYLRDRPDYFWTFVNDGTINATTAMAVLLNSDEEDVPNRKQEIQRLHDLRGRSILRKNVKEELLQIMGDGEELTPDHLEYEYVQELLEELPR